MQVVIAGGTGFVGRALAGKLVAQGHQVTILSRKPAASGQPAAGIEVARWDPTRPTPELFAGKDAVINLAGESIAGGRWTEARKQRILSSRVNTTRALVATLRECPDRPSVLVNASAVGYYGPRGDEELDEDSPAGDDFLGRVGVAWEAEALAAEALGLRVVITRLGLVLGAGGGLMAKMLTPFSLGLGGPIGSGKQWMSWVHLEDVVTAILFALENETVRGPVNVTSPHPARNRDFSRTLGRILGRPSWLPVPAPALRLSLGEMADMLLTGQHVLPVKLTRLGFKHRFPTLEEALRDVLGKK